MALNIGDRIAHYDVTALIGEGGMGQVYQATDTKLNRQVALKILPEAFATDPDRLARFQREAQVLASLNHPNIAAIHGLEDSEGTKALVLELVEGPTLAERIAKGPIPIDEALPVATQIAEALEAAHEAGVIHRDLKPANIKVRDDGTVKVLDFGLAEAVDTAPAGDPDQSPTLTAAATQMGVIMGTAAYMSPEQATGRAVDRSADVWAFGVVLFEMLTGERAFTGETVAHVLASVLKSDTDLTRLPAGVPDRFRELLGRCLERDLRRRLRDIREIRLAIEGASTAPVSDTAVGSGEARSGWRRALPYALSVAAGGAAVWAVASVYSSQAPSPAGPLPVVRTTITLPDGQRQPNLLGLPLAISPDGTRLVYVAQSRGSTDLYLRRLDSFEGVKIPDTENADIPFFSPDGEWVGFFPAGALKKVSLSGGSAQTITRGTGEAYGASWGPDDTIVFNPAIGAGLWRVSAVGDGLEQLTQPNVDEGLGYGHVWPQHLPDGRRVLFTVWGGGTGATSILDLETGRWDPSGLRVGVEAAQYLPSGHVLFVEEDVGRGVFVSRVNQGLNAMAADRVPFLSDVRVWPSHSSRPFLTVSRTGTVVYVREPDAPKALGWVDRQGVFTPILNDIERRFRPRLSPDGQRALVQGEGDLWIAHLARGSITPLRTGDEHSTNDIMPVWSPDGTSVTWSSNRAGRWDVWDGPAEGGVGGRRLGGQVDQFPGNWSSDGRLLTVLLSHPTTGWDIWMQVGGGETTPVVVTEFNEWGAVISPNGQWLAYVSDQSGKNQVYVRAYPDGDLIPVSRDGGDEPVWSPDERELFFRNADQMLAVTVAADAGFSVSEPVLLFEQPYERGYLGWGAYYDVAPDGERFLMVADSSATELQVIQNAFEELDGPVP